VVDCTALEMRHRCKPIGGSNPPLSAQPSRLSGFGAKSARTAWVCGSVQMHMSNSQPRHSGMRRRDKIAKLFCAEGADPESILPQ
jgi:hypothetical protein